MTKTKDQRYDIRYGKHGPVVEYHFYRDVDCFGTNPEHGMTYNEVCEEMAEWHRYKASEWESRKV